MVVLVEEKMMCKAAHAEISSKLKGTLKSCLVDEELEKLHLWKNGEVT